MVCETFSVPDQKHAGYLRYAWYVLYLFYDNDNDNDKVFYSSLIIHFILHITVINAFAY